MSTILLWIITAALVSVIIILVEMQKKCGEGYGALIVACSILAAIIGSAILDCSIMSIDKATVNLKKLPNKSEYYHYTNSDDKKTIEYLDGVEMVTLSVDEYKLYYDSNNGPYIEIEESKNLFGRTIQTKVVVHLEKLEQQK